MFDLEHFKSINDRFGYAVGDEVLRVFGQVVRASTRADDIIGRFGGEEFFAIVPGGVESASKIAERVPFRIPGGGRNSRGSRNRCYRQHRCHCLLRARHGNRRADFAHGGRLLPR
jgi:GGDEF domain-containing protein